MIQKDREFSPLVPLKKNKHQLTPQQSLQHKKQLNRLIDILKSKVSKSDQQPDYLKFQFIKRSPPKNHYQDYLKKVQSVMVSHENPSKSESIAQIQEQERVSRVMSPETQVINKHRKLKQIKDYIDLKSERKKINQQFSRNQYSKITNKIKYNKRSLKKLEESMILPRALNQSTSLTPSPTSKYMINNAILEKRDGKYISVVRQKQREEESRVSGLKLARSQITKARQRHKILKENNKRKQINANDNRLMDNLEISEIYAVSHSIQQNASRRQQQRSLVRPKLKTKSKELIQKLNPDQDSLESYHSLGNTSIQAQNNQHEKIQEARSLKKYINEQKIKKSQMRDQYYQGVIKRNKHALSVMEDSKKEEIMKKMNYPNKKTSSLPMINIHKNKMFLFDEITQSWKINPELTEKPREMFLHIQRQSNEKVKKF